MIQKYVLSSIRETHSMPKDADFLSVSADPHNRISLYFGIDPEITERETRTFWMVALGRTIPHDSNFLGTIEQDGINYHVFELLNRHERKTIIKEKKR